MSSPAPDPVDGPRAVPAGPGSAVPVNEAITRSTALLAVVVAVFVAGALGTAARLGVDSLLPTGPDGIPLPTVVINSLGSFALGLVVAALPIAAPEWLRAAVTTGLLGSFTTFSAITVAAAAGGGAGGAGGLLDAAILLAVSVVTGLAAAIAGIALGAALSRRRA